MGLADADATAPLSFLINARLGCLQGHGAVVALRSTMHYSGACIAAPMSCVSMLFLLTPQKDEVRAAVRAMRGR